METRELCLLATFSQSTQKTDSNEQTSWRWESYIQTSSWMYETRLFVIESHTLLIEQNIEIEREESSSNHLSSKAIETNASWRSIRVRPRQTVQTLRQRFISCAIDSHRCVIADSESCETECTSSKTWAIPKHTEQSKEKMMNVEKKYLSRLWLYSKMNCDCVKWCEICKSSWICEQSESTDKKILAKMIFWKQKRNQEHHQRKFIKRIEINDDWYIQLQRNMRYNLSIYESNQRWRFETLSCLQSRHQNWELNQFASNYYYTK